MHPQATALCLAAAAAAGLAAAPVSGDVTIQYQSNTQFTYEVTYMPDFDQRRDYLPGDGSTYCVPTSALDVCAFIARHGYPSVFPGSVSYWYWLSQLSYDEADLAVWGMGLWMNTSAQDGTYTSGFLNGLTIAGVALGSNFIVISQTGEHRFWQDITDMALAGALVMPVVGWYPNFEITVRTGGHVMALAELSRSGGSRQMGFRDPASDEGDVPGRLTMQSLFSTNTANVVDAQVQILLNNRTMSKLVEYSNSETLALIDGFVAIYPITGLTTSPDAGFQLFRPDTFPWDGFAGLIDFPIQFQGPVIGFDFAPNSPDIYAVTAEAVYQVSPISGVEEELLTLDDGTAIVFGRTPRLYTLEQGRILRCYDLTGDEPVEEASTLIPDSDLLVYDDLTDQVIAFDPSLQLLSILPKDLGGDPVLVPLPDIFIEGQAYMAISPADGRLWISSKGTPRHYLIRVIPDGEPIVEEHSNLVSEGGPMHVLDDGILLVTDRGIVKAFKEEGSGWIPNDEAPFVGWEVGETFRIMRSRSDYDPDVHDGPEYANVLPETTPPSVPDCVGDVNTDNSVNVLDLLAVLAALGTNDVDTDQAPPGGDGVVNVLDLLVILSNWGPCP